MKRKSRDLAYGATIGGAALLGNAYIGKQPWSADKKTGYRFALLLAAGIGIYRLTSILDD